MKTTDKIDAARIDLLLGELRLPGIKLTWAALAETADKEGWPAARLLADKEVTDAAQIIVIGDGRVLNEGARVAGVQIDVERCSLDEPLSADSSKPVFIDMEHLDPKTIPVGKVSRAGGSFAFENFKMALALGVTGEVEPAQDKRLP